MLSIAPSLRAGSRISREAARNFVNCRHVWRSLFGVTVIAFASGCAAPSEIEDTEMGSASISDEKTIEISPQALLTRLNRCRRIGGSYAKDAGGTSDISVCGLKNAVFFKADMDIDCDGKQSPQCNRQTDASYQPETAAADTQGKPLDAAKLPFLVVPGISTKWNYKNAGIKMGTVGLAIYNDRIEYGPVGDVGPKAIIGEASYAMAKNLGINPNPSTGGVSTGVTYIIFTGDTAVSPVIENHAASVEIGKRRAKQLLDENPATIAGDAE